MAQPHFEAVMELGNVPSMVPATPHRHRAFRSLTPSPRKTNRFDPCRRATTNPSGQHQNRDRYDYVYKQEPPKLLLVRNTTQSQLSQPSSSNALSDTALEMSLQVPKSLHPPPMITLTSPLPDTSVASRSTPLQAWQIAAGTRSTPLQAWQIVPGTRATPLPTGQMLAGTVLRPVIKKHVKSCEIDFNLRTPYGFQQPNKQQMSQIIDSIDGCTSVEWLPPFLIAEYKSSPQGKTLPSSIAGLPLWHSWPGSVTHTRPLMGRAGRGKPLLLDKKLNLWENPGVQRLRKIGDMFLKHYACRIRRIMWVGVRFLVEVDDEEYGRLLPSSVGGLLCLYRQHTSTKNRAATRKTIPTGQVIDNTNYAPFLRPGCLLESPDGLLTSSGIPVQSPSGKKYFTVASHAFTLGCETVYHSGNIVGESRYRMADTDISLVKPVETLTYLPEPFADSTSESLDGPLRFRSLLDPRDVTVGVTVHTNTPFNGRVQGWLLGVAADSIPHDEDQDKIMWASYMMSYFGNGIECMADGSCGSPVWTDDMDVVGFYRFYKPGDGSAYGPSVDPLIEAGYELCTISGTPGLQHPAEFSPSSSR